jgi:hypothetical protein
MAAAIDSSRGRSSRRGWSELPTSSNHPQPTPTPHSQPTRRAKYELQHVVRTNLAANDTAYNCVLELEDEAGVRGVKLAKELMSVAGEGGSGGGWGL